MTDMTLFHGVRWPPIDNFPVQGESAGPVPEPALVVHVDGRREQGVLIRFDSESESMDFTDGRGNVHELRFDAVCEVRLTRVVRRQDGVRGAARTLPYRIDLTCGEPLHEALARQASMPMVKIGQTLVDMKLISAAQLAEALVRQKSQRNKPLGLVLRELNLISDADLARALSQKLGIPFVDLNRFDIDPEAVRALPANMARELQVMPVAREGEALVVAMEQPLDAEAVDSAAESVVRLIELGMDPFNFADSLLGILGQRLARRLCRQCSQPRPVAEEEAQGLAREYCAGTRVSPATVLAEWQARFGKALQLREPGSCAHCRGTGYSGRIGIHELLSVDATIRHRIHDRANAAEIQELAVANGMHTLRQDGIEKALGGIPISARFAPRRSRGEAELRHGVAILPPAKRRTALAKAIEGILEEDFRDCILPFDRAAASAYAAIAARRCAAGRPISQFDCQIAAIAIGAVIGNFSLRFGRFGEAELDFIHTACRTKRIKPALPALDTVLWSRHRSIMQPPRPLLAQSTACRTGLCELGAGYRLQPHAR